MKLVYRFKDSILAKKILTLLIALSCFMYVFSIPSFGETDSVLRYIVYASMSVLGLLSFLYCLIYGNFKINKVALIVPVFALFAFIGTCIYSHQFRSWFSLVLLSGSFIVFVFAFKVLKNKYLIISIIAIAFFCFSIYFIVYYRNQIIDFKSYDGESFRLGSHFDNPNGVAAYAIVGVATALYLVLFWKVKFRYLFIVPVLTSTLVGFTTGSRTFILALFIFAAVFAYFKFQKHKWIYLLVLASLVILGIILLSLPFMDTIRERIIRSLGTIFGFNVKTDTSTISRVIWTDYGFALGSKNLLFGYGSDGFSIYSGVETYSHSNYSEVMCNFGLIGFILYYAPLLLIAIQSFKSKKIDKRFIVAFILYFLITGFSTVLYYKKIYYMILAFMYYLTFVETLALKKSLVIEKINKVVFTCDSMGSGGAEKVISVLANEMALNNISVSIIGVGDTKKPRSFYELDSHVEYLTLGNNEGKRINPFMRILLLKKAIFIQNPDIVISFLPNANIYTWISLIGTDIPYIVSERNNPMVDPKGKLTRMLKTLSFCFSNGAVFQTGDAMNFYSKGIKEKGVIIKNPIYVDKDFICKRDIRSKKILAVGRLVEQKNYYCLLDAFKLFNSKKNNEYILKIYGDGPLKEPLVEYTRTLQINDYVVFAGNDTKWQEKESDAAMYVLSSNYEGMPNALAEAMALGIPCISTDCPAGGSRELITDGFNGYLVPPNDSITMAKKMIQLSIEPPMKFSKANQNMVNQYSPKEIAGLWIAFIKELTKDIYE